MEKDEVDAGEFFNEVRLGSFSARLVSSHRAGQSYVASRWGCMACVASIDDDSAEVWLGCVS